MMEPTPRLLFELVAEVVVYLPASERAVVGTLSRALKASEAVWHRLYVYRFNDDGTSSGTSSSGTSSGNSSGTSSSGTSSGTTTPWREKYLQRLERPVLDDVVEVAWHGKFNLSLGRDARTVRAGCSWWAARIVMVVEPFYKVSYPGWSSGWDEWVKRSRVRWPAEEFRGVANVRAGHDVEICFRPESWQTRPPVWLEARVLRARKTRLFITPLPAHTKNKKFWIDRAKVCAARKHFLPNTDDARPDPENAHHKPTGLFSRYFKKWRGANFARLRAVLLAFV